MKRLLVNKKTSLFTLIATAALLSGINNNPAHAVDPIKLGLLEDESGNFAIAVIPKIHAVQLAVEEINAKGGVLGRPLQVIHYDTQSDNTRFQEMARRITQQDKVDVVFGDP